MRPGQLAAIMRAKIRARAAAGKGLCTAEELRRGVGEGLHGYLGLLREMRENKARKHNEFKTPGPSGNERRPKTGGVAAWQAARAGTGTGPVGVDGRLSQDGTTPGAQGASAPRKPMQSTSGQAGLSRRNPGGASVTNTDEARFALPSGIIRRRRKGPPSPLPSKP